MKRLFNLGILLLGVALVFSACKKKSPIDENNIQFVKAESTYWGDYYGNTNSIFDLVMYDNSLAVSSQGNLNGIEAIFDINASPGSTEIPAGTYKSGTSGNAYTFQRGDYDTNDNPYGSYFRVWKNNKVTETWLITSGDLIVQKSGQYVISGIITTEYNEVYEFRYNGSMETFDVTPWPETLKKGQVIFEDRVTGVNGDRNMFTILLGGNDVTFPGLAGNDDAMRIELYSPININNTIENGTYYVEIETENYFRIMDGFVGNDGNDYGTWYYTSEAFKVLSGDMIVSVSGNNYNLDYEFFIGENNTGLKISGVYKGVLTYLDNSAKVKSMMRAPGATESKITREGRTNKQKTLTPSSRSKSENDPRMTKTK